MQVKLLIYRLHIPATSLPKRKSRSGQCSKTKNGGQPTVNHSTGCAALAYP